MKVYISYSSKYIQGNIVISTEHDEPDKTVYPTIEIEASDEEIKQIILNQLLDVFEFAHGFYGHLFNIKRTSNLDLGAAARALKPPFQFISKDPPYIEPVPPQPGEKY
jgi:hypothetical protein